MRKRNFLKSHHVRRYRVDRYKNPLFSGSKKSSISKYLFRAAITAAVLVGVPWFLIAAPWFYVKDVNVEGSITLYPDQIERFAWDELHKKRWDVIPLNHIWLLNTSKLQQELTDSFSLQQAAVERDGRTVNITIKERITSLIWAQGERLLFVDQEGKVVRDLTQDETNDVRALIYGEGERNYVIQDEQIFLIFNEGGGDVSQNDELLTSGAIEVLSTMYANIEHYFIKMDSMSIEAPLSSWATIQIREGFKIYVDLTGDGKEQLSNLEVILQEYQGRLGELEYIDLRFGNRVYVK